MRYLVAPMNEMPNAWTVATFLLAAVLVLLEVGRRFGLHQRKAEPGGEKPGTGAVEGAVFAMLGLLVAFTFAGAADRFETRRQLIVDEANALGTAWMRVDLVGEDTAKNDLRANLQQYADARIDEFRRGPQSEEGRRALEVATGLQTKLWAVATRAASATPGLAAVLCPPLNDLFDLSTKREAAMRTHAPFVIHLMLWVLAGFASLFAGHAAGAGTQRPWLHWLGFAFVVATTVFVVLDLEYPRHGLLRIDAWDQLLVDARAAMK